jgi:hypothetical protein
VIGNRYNKAEGPLAEERKQRPTRNQLPSLLTLFLITDYRFPITDHFPFASMASAVLLRRDVPILFSNHVPERGGCILPISRVPSGCVPSLGFWLGA